MYLVDVCIVYTLGLFCFDVHTRPFENHRYPERLPCLNNFK